MHTPPPPLQTPRRCCCCVVVLLCCTSLLCLVPVCRALCWWWLDFAPCSPCLGDSSHPFKAGEQLARRHRASLDPVVLAWLGWCQPAKGGVESGRFSSAIHPPWLVGTWQKRWGAAAHSQRLRTAVSLCAVGLQLMPSASQPRGGVESGRCSSAIHPPWLAGTWQKRWGAAAHSQRLRTAACTVPRAQPRQHCMPPRHLRPGLGVKA